MKQRLLVMNGQRVLQSEQGGKWQTIKVEKAGAAKPGIYDIHLSALADKAVAHDGPILYADKDYVYQRVGNNYIKHDLASFDRVPDLGSHASVKYLEDKAIVSASSLKQGRKI
jgi:hypothetical protein